MKIISIPLNRTPIVGDILQAKVHYEGLADYIENANPFDNSIVKLENYQPIQLIGVDDTPIKEGDWYYNDWCKACFLNIREYKAPIKYYSNAAPICDFYGKGNIKKIIVSSTPLESIYQFKVEDLPYLCELMNNKVFEVELESEFIDVQIQGATNAIQRKIDVQLKLVDGCAIVKREIDCKLCLDYPDGCIKPCEKWHNDNKQEPTIDDIKKLKQEVLDSGIGSESPTIKDYFNGEQSNDAIDLRKGFDNYLEWCHKNSNMGKGMIQVLADEINKYLSKKG